MIKLQKVTKEFQTKTMRTTAVNKVSLNIEEGEFVSILGESGSGKSTLLSIIGLLDNFTNGEYFFKNELISNKKPGDLSKLRRDHIGFIFQSFHLIDELTVYENVELPLIYKKVSASERGEIVNSMLEKVGLSGRRSHFPNELSGGQKQRVAIARALAINPDLLLADEPTGNLDSDTADEIMCLLKTLNDEGMTVLMVTHSEKHAASSSRIIRFKDGSIVMEER